MSEYMTIRECLDWLAEDRENRVLRVDDREVGSVRHAMSKHGQVFCDYSVNVCDYHFNGWIEPRDIISRDVESLTGLRCSFDKNSLFCTKLYRPAEKSELEKAEEEALRECFRRLPNLDNIEAHIEGLRELVKTLRAVERLTGAK